MKKQSSLFLLIIGFLLGYFLLGTSREWRAWIYIANYQNISRIYLGSYDNLNACRYYSREYIKAHFNDSQDLKFEYVCGQKCDIDEGNCESRFSSGFLKYPPELSTVIVALNNIKETYDPEFLTYAWPWEYWYAIKKQRWGFGSKQDQEITDKYVIKYIPFVTNLNQYSDMTISNAINLYQSPATFEAVLKFRIEHPDFY